MAITKSVARTATPYWLSLGFAGALLLLLVTRVALAGAGPSSVLLYLAVGGLVATTAVRAAAFVASQGDRRAVERALLLCQLAVLVGLGVYWYAVTKGHAPVGNPVAGRKVETPALLLAAIAIVAGLVPLALIEFALGTARRSGFAFGASEGQTSVGVEAMRVRELAWSGLTIGLALSFLMVTCNVANQKNVRRDVSYFQTSSPGTSTRNIVASSSEPLKVLLFFPAVNEVRAEVANYFAALAKATGKLTVEEHDRLIAPELAAKYKVNVEGSIVLVKGDKSEVFTIDTDMQKAGRGAGKLRNLDREVNAALMKVIRDKRKAYLTVGHGEMNDRASIAPLLKDRIPERPTTLVRQMIGFLGYDVVDLNPADLVADVPKDATVVIMLGPAQSLEAAEQASLDRYLARGGRLLLAYNPLGEADFGWLAGKLGVTFSKTLVADDASFYPERNAVSDHYNVATTQVSAHASTTSLSRASRSRLPVVSSGTLQDAEFAAVPGVTEKPKRTYIIYTMDSTWADDNGNMVFDAAEKRKRYNIGAAIEGPKLPLAPGEAAPATPKDPHGHDKDKAPATTKDGYRVLVYGNANFFADAAGVDAAGRIRRTMIGGDFFLFDAVRWLGGEEVFSGEVVSEDDKPIKHTKAEDSVWFTLMLIGAPLLVLGGGLLATRVRRKRNASAKEAQS